MGENHVQTRAKAMRRGQSKAKRGLLGGRKPQDKAKIPRETKEFPAVTREGDIMPPDTKNTKRLMANIGLLVQARRKELGLSQENVASAMQMADSSISNMEKGEHQFAYPTLKELAKVLEMTVLELVWKIESMDKPDDAVLIEVPGSFGEPFRLP